MCHCFMAVAPPRPANGLLSLLALKLLNKERLSPIHDFNFEEATGLFARPCLIRGSERLFASPMPQLG